MRFISWNEKLGPPECPYLIRWVLNLKLFSLRLHHWRHSDDSRHFHDHPWSFITLVLYGGYVDVSPDGDDRLSVGSVRLRKAEHRHSVKVDKGGAWSIMVTGPEKRVWGFWVNGKFRKRNKYFFENGHHNPCD